MYQICVLPKSDVICKNMQFKCSYSNLLCHKTKLHLTDMQMQQILNRYVLQKLAFSVTIVINKY